MFVLFQDESGEVFSVSDERAHKIKAAITKKTCAQLSALIWLLSISEKSN